MNPSGHYDHIVIGVGSMGSAVCWQLAKRGCSVLGIDRFSVPHDRGSHGGDTRIVRKAYYEHPDYIPLLESAYGGWEELEDECDREIFFRTGLLYAGPGDSPILRGVIASADKYRIQMQKLPWSDSPASRFLLPEDYTLLFEPDAGFVMVDRALECMIDRARFHGAEILMDTEVVSWKKEGARFSVMTAGQHFTCDKLVITSGAWISRLLPMHADKLKVTRQLLAWYDTRSISGFGMGEFPCWLIADADFPGAFYGFPSIDDTTTAGAASVKVAYHFPGKQTEPDSLSHYDPQPEQLELDSFVSRVLKGISGPPVRTGTCLYTNSPDEHFIVDVDDGMAYACGFSGHGFKFSPAIGKVLADLSMYGKTDHPIGFLRAGRFS